MRPPRPSSRLIGAKPSARGREPRTKIAKTKVPAGRPDVGARSPSAADEREDGDMPFRKRPKGYRVSFGDTGLQADDFA